jgi:TolA-binding protein
MTIEKAPKRLSQSDSVFAPMLRDYANVPVPNFSKEKVWKRVVAQLQPRKTSHTALLGLLGVAAGIMLVLAWHKITADISGPLKTTDFLVRHASDDARLEANSVSTKSGSLVLKNEKLSIAATDHTSLRWNGTAGAILESGSVAIDSHGAFEVQVGPEVFEFHSTIAGFSFSANGQAAVFVEEGRVVVRTKGTSIELLKGQRWPTDTSTEGIEEALAILASAKDSAAKTANLISPVAPKQGVTPADIAPAQLIQQARKLTRNGQANAAMETYSKVTSSNGSNGEIALYERGLLRHQALKDAAGALADFDDYQHRFPQGALAAEVALTRVEVLLHLHRDELALAQMTAFVEGFPNSERLDEVRLMRGQILKDQGHCQLAANDFAAAQKNARWADEATWLIAACENTIDAMKKYSARFPNGAHAVEAKTWTPEIKK